MKCKKKKCFLLRRGKVTGGCFTDLLSIKLYRNSNVLDRRVKRLLAK